MTTKATTLRLDSKQAARLKAVARADKVSVTDVVREAIDAHIDARRADMEFQTRIKRMLEEEREVLEELAK